MQGSKENERKEVIENIESTQKQEPDYEKKAMSGIWESSGELSKMQKIEKRIQKTIET